MRSGSIAFSRAGIGSVPTAQSPPLAYEATRTPRSHSSCNCAHSRAPRSTDHRSGGSAPAADQTPHAGTTPAPTWVPSARARGPATRLERRHTDRRAPDGPSRASHSTCALHDHSRGRNISSPTLPQTLAILEQPPKVARQVVDPLTFLHQIMRRAPLIFLVVQIPSRRPGHRSRNLVQAVDDL